MKTKSPLIIGDEITIYANTESTTCQSCQKTTMCHFTTSNGYLQMICDDCLSHMPCEQTYLLDEYDM